MADATQDELAEQRLETLRRLHWAANEAIAAWEGTQTATAAASIASGARRKLLELGSNDAGAAA